jgi:hypothetical protein
MQTENEKAVRTLFEQWWNDKCANMPILDYGYQTLTQDIAFHAFKAALQSQVSNTPQDGPDFPDGHDWEGFPGGCERFGCASNCSPPQQEQSGEAVALDGPELWELLFGIFEGDVPSELTDDKIASIAEAINRAGFTSPATPTATASQESAPTSDQTGREPS